MNGLKYNIDAIKKHFDIVFSHFNPNNTRLYCKGYIQALSDNDLIGFEQRLELTRHIHRTKKRSMYLNQKGSD